jgi:hypothetical protein
MLKVIISTTGAKRKELVSQIGKQPSLEPIKARIVYTSPQLATVSRPELKPIFLESVGREMEEIDLEETDDRQGWEEQDTVENGPINVMAISFEGGDTLIVRPNGSLTKYDVDSGAIIDTQAKYLRKGDLVVLVDETTTHSLLEVILERLHKHPKMMFHVINQRAWINGLRKGMEQNNDDPATLLRKMQEKGSGITHHVTVRNWRRGIVIGPLDKEDVARLGRVYNDDFLINRAEDIYKSVERVREIHRRLARKLRFLVKRAGISIDTLNDDDLVVDAELGLYLEDFSDSVRVEEIDAIGETFSGDPRKAGKLFKGNSWRQNHD